jgi:hypothetical protein
VKGGVDISKTRIVAAVVTVRERSRSTATDEWHTGICEALGCSLLDRT